VAAYLARQLIVGGDAGSLVTGLLPAFRDVLVVAACVIVAFILLWLPVLGDRVTAYLSRNAPKFAPRIFLAGLGILATGLITRLVILDVVGASLIGLLALGYLFDNY
jgi:hypothetical protein